MDGRITKEQLRKALAGDFEKLLEAAVEAVIWPSVAYTTTPDNGGSTGPKPQCVKTSTDTAHTKFHTGS